MGTLIFCSITISIASQLRKHEELSAHAAHGHSGLKNLTEHLAEHHNMTIAEAREHAATHNGSIREHIEAHHEHAEHEHAEHAEEEAEHDEEEHDDEEGEDKPEHAEPTEFVQKHNHSRLRNLSRRLARHHNEPHDNETLGDHERDEHDHDEHEH